MATSSADLIRQAILDAQKMSAVYADTVRETAKMDERASSKMYDLVATVHGATGVQLAEQAKATMEVQEAKARAREAAGGEAKMLQGIRDVTAKADAANAAMTKFRATGARSLTDFFSDPVGIISDVVNLPGYKLEANNAITEAQVALAGVTQRHTALQAGYKEAEDAKITVNAATMQADAQKILASQQTAMLESEIKGRALNLVGIEAVTKMSLQNVDLAAKLLSTDQAVEQMRNARAQLAMSQESHKKNMELVNKRLEQEGQQLDEIGLYSQAIARQSAANGVAITDPTMLRVMAKQALQNPDSTPGKLAAFGLRNMALGKNSNMIGADPAEAQEAKETFDVKLPESVQMASQILEQVSADMAADKKLNIDRKKQPDAWKAEFNKRANVAVAESFANPTRGSIADFTPQFSTYIQSSPAAVSLPVYQKLLGPMIAAGQDISDPNALMRLGVKQVAEGTLTSDELVGGMTAAFRIAAMAHAQTTRLGDLGFVPPAAGIMYNTRLSNVYGGYVKVNLVDYTDLSKWVARHLALVAMPELQHEKTQQTIKNFFDTKPYLESIKRGAKDSYLNNPN